MASKSNINLFDPPPGFTPLNPRGPISNTPRNLPHWRQHGATYFVTLRLADSLPRSVLDELKEIRERWQQRNPEPNTPEQLDDYAKQITTKSEHWLDAGAGSCLFANRELAKIVDDALYFFDSDRYFLFGSVVMANHIHIIIKPIGENSLDDIIASWIKFTSRELKCSDLVQQKSIWWSEPYDRMVRDNEHLQKVISYIGQNPVKAGVTRDATFCRLAESWINAGWRFDENDDD